MRRKNRILQIAIVLVVVAAFAWYLSSSWSDFQSLSIVNPLLFIPIAVLVILNIFTVGSLVETAIEPHGVKLKPSEIFGLSSLTRFGNYTSPGYLGTAIRATYIKKVHGVSYTKFSSSFIVSSALQFLISGIIALVIYFSNGNDSAVAQPIIIIGILLLVLIAILKLPLGKITSLLNRYSQRRGSKILDRLHSLLVNFDKVRVYPGILSKMFLWMLLTLLVSSLMLILLYRTLGFDIGALEAIFITALGGWSIIFSITPANIGIREGLMALAAQLMSVPIPETLAVAILLRVVTFIVITVFAIYFAPKLLGSTVTNLKKATGNKTV